LPVALKTGVDRDAHADVAVLISDPALMVDSVNMMADLLHKV